MVLDLPRGAVEAGTGHGAVAQAVPGHRQEEQVVGVELALADGQALFEHGHGLSISPGVEFLSSGDTKPNTQK